MNLFVLDPPWNADTGGGRRGANTHYDLSGVDGIAAAVKSSGVWNGGPGLMWLWATSSAVVKGDAHELAAALGFRVCAGFVWAKIDDHGEGKACRLFASPRRPGLGQWSRCEHEHLLLCRSGDVKVPPPASRQRSVIYAPRRRHSEKPEEAWAVIEATSAGAIGVGVGVEFFARTQRPGWVAWGTLNGGRDVVTAGVTS